MSGRIIAFDDEEFLVTKDPADLRSKLYSAADTVETPDYDSAGNEIMVTTIKKADTTIYYQSFCSLQLKEDWFFDKQKSSLEVRIVGLGLNFIPVGKEDIGCTNLFWVYYPACRPLFAKYEVFNVKNGAWGCLGGAIGRDSLSNNRLLIAQITTDGELSFELNIQIGKRGSPAENYVAKNPTGKEISLPFLIYQSKSTKLSAIKNKKPANKK